MSEQSIFLGVLELNADERNAYLAKACAGNDGLRREVEALLAAHERSGTFLDEPAMQQIARSTPADDTNTVTAASDSDRGNDQTVTGGQARASVDEALAFLKPPTRSGSIGRLDHYEILEHVGSGGFGTVLKAFDDRLHRVVAIKMLAPQLAASGTARARFDREARSAAAVKSEHIVGIHAIEVGPHPYLVMEYIEGQTLQQKIDRTGPLGVKEILRIAHQIAAGLAAAHATGLVHRDIKPANVLLENGVERVKITDFGLARAADDASISQSGVVAGTPTYMAPEQARGDHIDHRADLFSLGSVLYVMCTGRPPFRASTTMAVLKRVVEDVPRAIREINPEIPQWLCDIVTKLHAKKPEDRFQSATEVADLLANSLSNLQLPGRIVAEEIGQLQPRREPVIPVSLLLPSSRDQWLAAVQWTRVAMLLLVVSAGGVLLLVFKSSLFKSRQPEAESFGTVKVAWRQPERAVVIRIHETNPPHGIHVVFGPSMSHTPVPVVDGSDNTVPVGGRAWRGEAHIRPGSHVLRASENGVEYHQEALQIEEGQTYQVRIPDPPSMRQPPEEGWTQLFNRKDLTGWKTHANQLGNWRVQDGMLIGRPPRGHLFSERGDYTDFHLRVEAKVGYGDNSGIFFRCSPGPEFDYGLHESTGATPRGQHFPIGYEADISGPPSPSPKLKGNSAITDGPVGLLRLLGPKGVSERGKGAPVERDQWFALEVIARGEHIVIRVNGKTTVDWTDPARTFAKGHLALQVFGPGTSVHFRKIEIKELPASSPSGTPPKNALAFDGTSYVELPLLPYTAGAPLCVEMWATPGPPPKDEKAPRGLGRQALWASGFWSLMWHEFDTWSFTRPFTNQVSSRLPPVVGHRTHLAAVWDGKSISLFVNGQFQQRSPPSPRPAQLLVDEKSFRFNRLGAANDTGKGLRNPYFGTIEQVRISRIARYADDFRPPEGFTPDPDTISLYRFDEGQGDTLNDASGNGHHGKIRGAKWVKVGDVPSPDVPRRASEVLPFFAGNWKTERVIVEPKLPPEDAHSFGHATFEWVADGRFMRTHGRVGDSEHLLVYSLDAERDVLRCWFASASGALNGPAVGVFKAEKRTLLWMEILPDGNSSIHEYEFVDSNTIKTRLFNQAPDNKIVADLRLTFTRLQSPATIRSLPTDPTRPAEMKNIDRLIGEWKHELTVTESGKQKAEKSGSIAKPILAGRMVEVFETNETRTTNDYWLTWYDAFAKQYRTWYFAGDGSASNFTGAWDEAKKSISWKSADNTVNGKWLFKSDDVREMPMTVKDKAGKVLMESHGVSRRVAAPKLPSTPDQVLPALAGAWKGEFTQKIYGGKPQEKKFAAVAVNDWIVGGKWLRQRVHMEDGGFVSLVNFQPGANSFRDWFFHARGLIFGPSAGRWDQATRTMTWTNLPENGLVNVTTWRFFDASTVTGEYLIRDKEGLTIFEMTSLMKRTSENVAIDETTAAGPLPPEMAVLDRLMGDWQTSGVIKDAKSPDGRKSNWHSSVRSILGGRVIATQRTGSTTDDDESYTISTFDIFSKAYGRWSFRPSGNVLEYGGLWDEKNRTLKWHWAGKDGSQTSNTWNLSDPNRRDWQVLTKDALGKTTVEVEATSVRQGDLERLQGAWRAVAVERVAKAMMPEEVQALQFEFDGNKIRYSHLQKEHVPEGVFTLDPTKDPKHITVKLAPDSTFVIEGLYKFDGDTLVLCMPMFGAPKPRAKKFELDASDPARAIMTFVRDEAKAKEPDAQNLQALRDVIAAKDRIFANVKLKYKAGQLSKIELNQANAEVVEARARFAHAAGDKAAIAVLIAELFALWKEERSLVDSRVKAGVDAMAVLDVFDARIADAKTRLATSGIDVTQEPGPPPREIIK